jgi:SAM-dependent methyltransferase
MLWHLLPKALMYQFKRSHENDFVLPVGSIDFGSLRRVIPISKQFGFDRGLPVDRYYINRFLSDHAADVHGRVLEIGDDTYTRKFGGANVQRSDVLHVTAGNPKATIVGDITNAEHIPSNVFDCIVFLQTLQLIYDVHAALNTLYRILKPGGVVLATFPGISQKGTDEWAERWQWGFTIASARQLFGEFFSPASITACAYGNVLTAISFLHGIVAEELTQEELDHTDPAYELLIGLRAVKPRNEHWA